MCQDPSLDAAALRAQRRDDSELLNAVVRGKANAVDEARKAIAKGDFRLAASVGGSAYRAAFYGAECRIPFDLDSRSMRVLDFADSTGKGADAGRMRFGTEYNAAVLSDPSYPYSDICRLAADIPKIGSGSDQQGFGFPYEVRQGRPQTLGEAARGDSSWTLRGMIKTNPDTIDKPDIFGMTPLAWAVAYRRLDAVEMLLRAKASPGGPQCQTVVDMRSPMQVARHMQWKRMVQRFLPLVSEADRKSLEQKTAAIPGSLTEFNKVLIELNQRYEETLGESGPSRHSMLLEVDEKGNTTSCKLEPATSVPRFDAELCANAVLTLKWNPARNINGKAVKGETAISLVGIGL